MRKKGILRSNMAVNMISVIILLLVIFGVIVSASGFVSFTGAMRKEYDVTTYHMADTAATLVNGDHLEDYLAGEETEEYLQTKEYLDAYCRRMHVSLIYVILVDRSDYGRFVSVFNPVDNSVDDSSYAEWELGHKRDTTNDEYRKKYKAIYEEEVSYATVYRTKTTDGQHPHITTMVPVKNSAGEVAAILCMQRPIRELQGATVPYFMEIAITAAFLAALSSFIVARFLQKNVVNPIKKISDEATRFAKDNTKGTPLGDISSYKDISNLANSIDTMETDMVQYVENLTTAAKERSRLGAELKLAGKIQENSIPNVFPPFPDRHEFDLYASMTPAKSVGGDFYNFFLVDEDHLVMMIGDVSGKGIPAAMFMMVTNIMITDRIQMGGSPAEVLEFVNNQLCEHNKENMFVTLWLGVLEISSGRVTAVNAGHECPVVQSDGLFSLLKDKHGFVTGGMPNVKYVNYEIQLKPGDKLFLYTDGVPEATDADNKLFGLDRMLEVLNAKPEDRPELVIGNIHEAVAQFVGETTQFDDLTMLCMEYRGSEDKENDC